MGLIDFIKDAGAKLLGADDQQPDVKAPQIDRSELDRRRANALARHVQALGLKVENLSLSVDGDRAAVAGQVADQATREKVVLAIGNIAGIGSVDDQLEVEAVEPEAVYYTVQRGDTLSKIAKQQYGNAMKYPVIFEANRPMLSDPDKIYPGQVLRIPPQAG